MDKLLASLFIVLFLGCTAIPVQRQAAFVEEEFTPFAGTGTSAICGQAFLKTVRGEVMYGAGNDVLLFPVTTYTRESFQKQIIEGRTLSEGDPRASKYLRSIRADSGGQFCFEKIPAGEYYVVSHIVWQVEPIFVSRDAPNKQRLYANIHNSKRNRGGWAHAQVVAKPHETTRAIVTR